MTADEEAALRIAADVETLIAKQRAAGMLTDAEHDAIARDIAATRRLATRPILNLRTLRTEGISAGPEPSKPIAAGGTITC